MLNALALPLINRLLRQQAWAASRLAGHAGKTAHVEVSGIGLRVSISADGQLLPAAAATAPDVTIRLPAQALSTLGDGLEGMTRHARIEGDAQLAETIAELLRDLRPDIGATLSPILGDVIAQRIDQGITSLTATLAGSAQRARTNVRDYLVNESPALVGRTALDDFSALLRTLRDDLARLEKRVERL